MEYDYVRVMASEANLELANRAADGWLVHTFNRNHNSAVVDILFEREAPEPLNRAMEEL